MKKLLLSFVVLLAAIPAVAQNVRYDAPFPSVSSTTATPYLVANTAPNSPILAVCNSPANAVPCTNYATTYNSAGAACSNGAQDTPQPQPSSCQPTGDAQGNIGFWAPAGKYDYTVCISGTVSCFGPYTVTLGLTSTGGGTVTGATAGGGLVAAGGGTTLGLSSCSANQVQLSNGSAWACGKQIPVTTVAGLASVLGLGNGSLAVVTDGSSSSDCTAGSGSTTLLCKYNGSVWSAVGGTTFATLGPGTNNSAAMVTGTGSNHSTSGSGQIAASQTWAPNINIQKPTVTTSGTGAGGSFANGHSALVQITFNTATGETLAGPLAAGVACAAGGGCTATVTAPTIPAGYTGYTVYSCDESNSSTCAIGSLSRQTALAACVNITTSCVISTPGAGSAAPTVTTAFVQPPNLQASDCPPSVLPTGFIQTNDGNYHTQSGVSTPTTNGLTGVLVDCRQHFFTDYGAATNPARASSEPIAYNNSFMAINHLFGQYTSTTNQDRALSIWATNPANDSSTRYAMEGLQIENDFNCNGCTINGSPDGEVTNLSLQFQDTAATNFTPPSLGMNVIRAEYYKAGPGATTSANYNILNAIFQINDNTFQNGDILSGLKFQVSSSTSTTTNNVATAAVLNLFNTTKQFTNGQFALYSSGVPLGANNYLIRNDGAGVPSLLNGPATLSAILNNNAAALPVTGSTVVTPSVTVNQASVLAPLNATCTGGASSYSYFFVGVDGNGGQFVSTAGASCNTGTNPLTSGNPASVNNNLLSNVVGQFVRIDVYRTAGPMALGKIGSLTCAATAAATPPCATNFLDTGLAAGAAIPTANTTGTVAAQGYLTTTNCAVNSASPAACGSATSGAVVIPTTTTTYTVNTTQITAASRIQLTWLTFASNLPSAPTCVAPSTTTMPTISNIVAGTSFTIALTSTTGQTCPQFEIFN
jgi:hypothetical protein